MGAKAAGSHRLVACVAALLVAQRAARASSILGSARSCCEPSSLPVNSVRWSSWRHSVASADVEIPCATEVILDQSTGPLASLVVKGSLVVEDNGETIEVTSDYIYVCGELVAGSESEPHTSPLFFTLTGERDGSFGPKSMVVEGGFLKLHGSLCQKRTWTTLDATAAAGSTELVLSEPVEWADGTRIMITSTDFSPMQTEENTVMHRSDDGLVLSLAQPLTWPHAGVSPITAEVAALSRNIVIRGEDGCQTPPAGTPEWRAKPLCGHMMFSFTPRGVVCGVEFTNMGRHTTTGKYPLHMHMCGETAQSESNPDGPIRLLSNSLHDNHHRAIVVHATSSSIVQDNVLFRTQGHLLIFEDGAEEKNKVVHNLFGLAYAPLPQWNCTQALIEAGAIKRSSGSWIMKDENGRITGHCAENIGGQRCTHGTGTLTAICGNRKDDEPNAMWIANPANFIVGNHAIGNVGSGVRPNSVVFRYECQGLTGAAAALPEIEKQPFCAGMDPAHRCHYKWKPMGPGGAFRDNVVHSADVALKNYPAQNPDVGLRFERFSAWKTKEAFFATNKFDYEHPDSAAKTSCTVPVQDLERAMNGDTEEVECSRRCEISNSTFLMNKRTVHSPKGHGRVHVTDSDVSPVIPPKYSRAYEDAIASGGVCASLGQGNENDKERVCAFSFPNNATALEWFTADQAQAIQQDNRCQIGNCTKTAWYQVINHKIRGKLIKVGTGTYRCINEHTSGIHGSDQTWPGQDRLRMVMIRNRALQTLCKYSNAGAVKMPLRFPAVSFSTPYYFEAFKETDAYNWHITADEYTIHNAQSFGFAEQEEVDESVERGFGNGLTDLAGITATTGSYNKGYVAQTLGKLQRVNGRYPRSLSDPGWFETIPGMGGSADIPSSSADGDSLSESVHAIVANHTQASAIDYLHSIYYASGHNSQTNERSELKRGLALRGGTCADAEVMGLHDSWYYNWAAEPHAGEGAYCACDMSSARPCDSANKIAAEFVPMLWTCKTTDCSQDLPADYRSAWMQSGVRALLGFNEPDNAIQANLSPAEAASRWPSVQRIADEFDPPLALVAPGMTHWNNGGSEWLDQFFGNCSHFAECDVERISYVAFHDYSGNAASIIRNANAAWQRYGKKVWLTEFAVGGKSREVSNNFMMQVLPMLDSAESIHRYAWFATRNIPESWVKETNLLPYSNTADGWATHVRRACANFAGMQWLGELRGVAEPLAQCQERAAASTDCAEPKTVAFEKGEAHGCYCATSTECVLEPSSWLDVYVKQDGAVAEQLDQNATSLELTSTGKLYSMQHSTTQAIDFTVRVSENQRYLINGEEQPNLVLVRGARYIFDVSVGAQHPFLLQKDDKTESLGTSAGSAYTEGVTNNGAYDGKLSFIVPLTAPDTLFYICQYHSWMKGMIDIVDSSPACDESAYTAAVQSNCLTAKRLCTSALGLATTADERIDALCLPNGQCAEMIVCLDAELRRAGCHQNADLSRRISRYQSACSRIGSASPKCLSEWQAAAEQHASCA